MKFLSKTLSLVTLCISSASFPAFSIDVFQADEYFAKQQYELARKEYSDAAIVGNPHAYYQLGTLYYKGLGVKQDSITALVWFSLAAEYQYYDSEDIVKEMLKTLSEPKYNYFSEIILAFKNKFGKQIVDAQFFPEIDETNLALRVTFDGEGKLSNTFHDPDLLLADYGDESNFSGEFNFDDEFSDENGGTPGLPPASQFTANGNIDGSLAFVRPRFTDLTRKNPFLVIDYEVGPDGSIRNISELQTIGYSRRVLERFAQNSTAEPSFNGERVNFINRSYLGTADYDSFEIRNRYKQLYSRIGRYVKRWKNSDTLQDKYQYAMALTKFSWLKREEGEAEKRLKVLAEAGHAKAQYEYGLTLYREQKDIKQAIHWISEASKYGLSEAEYLLGQILYTSPWVKNDQQKALFWFESAAAKGYVPASLKFAELSLLADEKSLHDVPKAIEYLDAIATQERENPQYYFLQAVSHKNRDNRQFENVVKNMELAIHYGEIYNWDVSYWKSLLAKWVTGSVSIRD
ncbi:tetratricopeptide repeat protein [Paraglaciecola sp.]|uniref:tetratricopeptide repeat protein n=1 Tax=Paraglaciecola sp. TaxID=1920173 RepID=UPI003EFAE4DB